MMWVTTPLVRMMRSVGELPGNFPVPGNWHRLISSETCICRDRAWEKREALLEIARREKLGLPLIDANFVDPRKINLPSDEELGDFDIIV